jgi:hypothetical protein
MAQLPWPALRLRGLKNMQYENPALVALLTANIIGWLAAEYSDRHVVPLAQP